MAMIDYGVIAKKNGKIITKEMFTPMKDTIGVEFKKDTDGNVIEGNYFVYLGDADFYVGIYKSFLKFFSKDKVLKLIWGLEDGYMERGKKYSQKITVSGIDIFLKRINERNSYYGKFIYKGDKYEFLYGYGVDINIDHWYDQSPKTMRKVKRFLKEI